MRVHAKQATGWSVKGQEKITLVVVPAYLRNHSVVRREEMVASRERELGQRGGGINNRGSNGCNR